MSAILPFSDWIHFTEFFIDYQLFYLLDYAIVSKHALVKIGKVMLNEINVGASREDTSVILFCST